LDAPLNASARTVGSLFSSASFEIPQFQREYSWAKEEVSEFWSDLSRSLNADSYFIGLIILTEHGERRHVVDGQQRLITISLLVNAIYHEALSRGRNALADKIQSDFLRSINYQTDETAPRIILTDVDDNRTFQTILETGEAPERDVAGETVSAQISTSYRILKDNLTKDIRVDPFKRLGQWSEFLTNRLYVAVFVHPDDLTAYQVYEVINTRGKDLTTADLLKNYILSQTPNDRQHVNYERWRRLSRQFGAEGSGNFVQYIRHVVTVDAGHVLPKDLFAFIADRHPIVGKRPPTPLGLLDKLESRLGLYSQMVDPTAAGPGSPYALGVFAALNSLGVIAVRPMLMAIFEADPDRADEGMRHVLELVVRRIVVGNLGTGNVERRFGEAAKKIRDARSWSVISADLKDLNPLKEDFERQLKRRSFNKGTLSFLRASIIGQTQTPEHYGTLHYIWTPQFKSPLTAEQGSYWGSTIGNTYLAKLDRRPPEADDWAGFKAHVLPEGVDCELRAELEERDEWDAEVLESMGDRLASIGSKIWY
jgi:Protein of unknown function DUF262